ncbi:hypothetical protein, partial [Azovibrio restrictus]|uniref:hypothetical protein n=1 Tax=Azovibrio restrictus TaxID=146938 RepID=UPI0005B9FEFC
VEMGEGMVVGNLLKEEIPIPDKTGELLLLHLLQGWLATLGVQGGGRNGRARAEEATVGQQLFDAADVAPQLRRRMSALPQHQQARCPQGMIDR